jgi:hypothetical protein
MRYAHLATLAVALACATPQPVVAPGRSTAAGSLRLVPREGVTPRGTSSSPYADRSLRDVRFVDYAHPGFAVVFLEGREAPSGVADVAIRASKLRTRLEPAELAIARGGRLRVHNDSAEPHVLSFPSAGRVQRLAAGEALEIPVELAGPQSLFLLDVPGSEVNLFAAPGPFARVADDGSWEIRDVEPGRVHVVAWHARFPATSAWLELVPERVARLDLRVGVGRAGDSDETN